MPHWGRWFCLVPICMLPQVSQGYHSSELSTRQRRGDSWSPNERKVFPTIDSRGKPANSSLAYRPFLANSVGRYIVAAYMLSVECLHVYSPAPVSFVTSSFLLCLSKFWGTLRRSPLSAHGDKNRRPGLSYEKFMSREIGDTAEESTPTLSLNPPDKYRRLSSAFKRRHRIGGEQTNDNVAPPENSKVPTLLHKGLEEYHDHGLPSTCIGIAVKKSGIGMAPDQAAGRRQRKVEQFMGEDDDLELLSDPNLGDNFSDDDEQLVIKPTPYRRWSKAIESAKVMTKSLKPTTQSFTRPHQADGKTVKRSNSRSKAFARDHTDSLADTDDSDAKELLTKLRRASTSHKENRVGSTLQDPLQKRKPVKTSTTASVATLSQRQGGTRPLPQSRKEKP